MSIGKSVARRDAAAHVTGITPYAANLKLPGMLYGKALRSPLPHARILSIDTHQAQALPGVVAVMTAADFDQPGAPELLYGVIIKDQPILAREKVRFVGEPVALVAAENLDIAEAALRLIEVDYENLPAIYDPIAALEPGAPILHETHPDNRLAHIKLRHGDLDAGFAAADEIIEETYTSPVASHVTLEPHTTIAQWQDGQLTVWTGTQAPLSVHKCLTELFKLPPAAVRVIVPPLGGGYGGKGGIRIEPMVAALAWKTNGRPVKLALTRAETFITATKHAAVIHIKTGVKRDGSLTARQITATWNSGSYADASPGLVRAGLVRAIGPYRIPAVRVDSYAIYTNLPPAAAFRGAMASQGTWAYESHMDSIAHRLGFDPLPFRLQNLLVSGDHFATGEAMHDLHFAGCLQAAADGLGWEQAPSASPEKTLKRGRGLAVMMKSAMPSSKSQCRMVINNRAEVMVYTSTVEMGQGAHTVLAQIAAEALGLSLEQIDVTGPDTLQTPFDSATSAARSTTMMGNAVLDGAAKLKQKLIEAAALILEYSTEELIAQDGAVFAIAQPAQRLTYAEILRRHQIASLEALGTHETSLAGLDPETGQGISTPHWHQGAGACEVEVDTETGKVTVLRYWSASYAGRVINPALARLQNDGNVIFGLGPALMEEVIFDEGQIANPNLSDYNIPAFLDIPRELHSVCLEAGHGEFHGIGEMTLPPVAPAIANAIFDAVGVRLYDLPITPEKVLRALQHEI